MFHEYEQSVDRLRSWMSNVEANRGHNIENEIDQYQSLLLSVVTLGQTLSQQNDLRSSDLDGIDEDVQRLQQRWIALPDRLRSDTSPRRGRLISEYERIFQQIKDNNAEGVPGMRKELRSLEVRSTLISVRISSVHHSATETTVERE